MNKLINKWINKCINKWKNECIKRWINECINEWIKSDLIIESRTRLFCPFLLFLSRISTRSSRIS